MALAEEVRKIWQERVDAASDAAQPDRVLRGGSWHNSAWNCRSAYRYWVGPDYRVRFNGFRLCVFPGQVRQEPETGQAAESVTAATARRDDAAMAEVADGADLDEANLPPRSVDFFPNKL